jgi:hypothetical protein
VFRGATPSSGSPEKEDDDSSAKEFLDSLEVALISTGTRGVDLD